mmetsp:Transcript_63457/g.174726  ORF Transcript_63457/g.174726 Transcript_63457/m.174726 type:complete len:338 (+) Transcript_63457:170-1183(+)
MTPGWGGVAWRPWRGGSRWGGGRFVCLTPRAALARQMTQSTRARSQQTSNQRLCLLPLAVKQLLKLAVRRGLLRRIIAADMVSLDEDVRHGPLSRDHRKLELQVSAVLALVELDGLVRHVHHLEQHLGLLAEGARRLREDSDVIARDGLFHRLDSLRRRDRRLDLGLGGGVGGHLGALHEGPDLLDDLIRLHPAHNPVHLLPLLEVHEGGEALDGIFAPQVRKLLCIDLHDRQRVLVVRRQLLQDRRHLLAGSTPSGVEVDQARIVLGQRLVEVHKLDTLSRQGTRPARDAPDRRQERRRRRGGGEQGEGGAGELHRAIFRVDWIGEGDRVHSEQWL